jgi:hypothetical protein
MKYLLNINLKPLKNGKAEKERQEEGREDLKEK